MASPDAREISTGLSKVAHAIRRSTALHVAMSITDPEEGIDGMLATADRLAQWIGGQAAESEAGKPRWQPPE